MAELIFCRYCGQHVDTPCVDATDLHIYSRTVDRCSDAAVNYEGERHFEDLAVTSTPQNTGAE